MSFLANLFRGSTISREVPTVNYPAPGEVTPSLFPSGGPGTSIVTTEPAQPEATTRTISTRRPPPLLAFIADFLAGLSRQGAGPGIQARLQSQQDDLNRQMKEIDREPQLKEAEYEKSKPQWKVNSDGSVVMVRPGLLETQGARAVTVFGKKESDPIKFEETLAKVQKDYGVEFTPRDRARAYLKYQAYLGQEKENRNPSQFFGELEQIVSEGQKRETEQGLFDNNFDDAKSALLSLGPFDKEEQAQVGAAIANSQLKKTVQPLQLLATSIAGKRDVAQARQERGGVADTFKQIQRLNQQANQEDKLRGDYEQEVKDLVTVRNQYDRIAVAMKEQTPASDISLVFAYMKMLDPTSVVRESEY